MKNEFKIRVQNLPEDESVKLLSILWSVLRENNDALKNEPDLCGRTIGQVIDDCMPYKVSPERSLKDIALLAYGNDLLSTCNQVSALCLMGSGECPSCGSDDVKGDIYIECLNCGKEFHREVSEDVNYSNS